LTGSLSQFMQSGAADAWVFVPSALMLGALHGLEPGHSKTMMAAFIIAVRGTVGQAALLGLAATVSHTAIVWIAALTGLYLGLQWSAESSEPYLEIASGLLILGVAGWMSWRNWRDRRGGAALHGHARHSHDGGAPPDTLQKREQDKAFDAELQLIEPDTFTDEHERAHAEDINRRFRHRHVTTGQIILFGLSGGLIPCPAAITVLLLCLQLGKLSLGVALVLCFSLGLAATMVLVGAAAALGARHVSARWRGLEAVAARAPYFSSAIVSLLGLYALYLGFAALV
jgi:nickel/cobalt exporter